MRSVSVIIPTYNGGAVFQECMRGLRAQVYGGPVELVVIDSGSQDGTLAAARSAGARILQIPNSEFNHGLTRNKAIEASSGDIVLLVTQDAVPADERLIASLVAAFDDPQVAGAYARQIPRPEHDVLIASRVRQWVSGSATRRVSQMPDRATFEKMRPMERYLLCVFDNVCSALRRSTWREIPLWANDFGEDLDWSKRALAAGWKIVYEPEAAVVHSHDRPIRYEYERTYMCHRTLYRLFGLQTIAQSKYILRNVLHGSWKDMTYAWRHQPGMIRKLSLMTRIPLLTYASAMGQFHGARDEQLKRSGRRVGV